MATIADKFSKVSTGVRPLTTTVDGTRATSGATLSCADLTGWDTDKAVHGVTYKLDGQGAIIAGSQLDFKGVVSGNTITNFTVTGGTDAGNAVGDIVQATPTAAWAKDLADGILTSLDDDGTLKAGAVDNAAVLASNVVTTAKILAANVTDDKWRNGVAFYATTTQSITISSSADVTTYTEVSDVGSNFNHTTGIFTAPVAGIYHFSANLRFENVTDRIYTQIIADGTSVATAMGYGAAANNDPTGNVSITIPLAANDEVKVLCTNNASATASLNFSSFSGFLVTRT